ncbi:hypothetical protein BKA82DRAFT_4192141 [Pisolithus tinctorius]|nr:hypothetical protein BKA82DRAFT_4192141 [Pisolithus tinctorius]
MPLHYAQLPTCCHLIEQGAEVDAVEGNFQAIPLQYKALHLVTHSSSIMPLLYHLHQPVCIDSCDMQGHTPLRWAAYQGDALSIDLLLKQDNVSLSLLRWAVGCTPRDMAVELKSFGTWKRSMEEGGMNEFSVKKAKPLSERNTCIAIFVLPVLFLYIIFTTLSILLWYTGMVLAMAEFFALHHIVTCVLLNKDSYVETVNRSPYFVGIITGLMTWVGYVWLTRLPPNHLFIHLAFALNMGLCIIEDLASEGRLNGQVFCIQCMAKKPLCSKHCHMCDWCVARSDHHFTGIILFDYLTYEFYASATTPDNIAADCSPIFCVSAAIDSLLLLVLLWLTLQLALTSFLLLTQFWQDAHQLTTLEVSNLGCYVSMGGHSGLAAGSGATGIQMGHHHHHMVNNDQGDEKSEGKGGPKYQHHHVGLCKALSAPGTCGAFLLNLVALNHFTHSHAAHGLTLGSSSACAWNPFNLGLEVGVDYGQVYNVPPEGFEEGKRKRDAEWGEFEHDHDGRSRSKSLLAKLGLRMTTSSSWRGYKPLSQV